MPGCAVLGQSIAVDSFGGDNENGALAVSPMWNASSSTSEGSGGEIYSCTGSVVVEWTHTGLLEEVNIRVSIF